VSSSVSAAVERAFAAPIEGWDFSWLRGRAHETPPPWDFQDLVRTAIADSRMTLDIDTGGGEFLERIAPRPGAVVATEGHPPNVSVAGRRLAPLGIPVVQARSAPDNVDQPDMVPDGDGSELPFRSDSFDLAIDRHSSYGPEEVHRVLRSGGRFLTQQRSESGSDGEAWESLFRRPFHPRPRFDVDFASRQLEEAGFDIERAEEADTPMVFRDLEGVVYYLRLVPWAVEEFHPEADRAALEGIQQRLKEDGHLRVRGSHLLIDAVTR
jgi:SAM-dependent methyltransferase